MRKLHLISLAAVSVSLFGLGCNPAASITDKIAEKASESVAEKIVESATGGQVDIDTNKNGATFRDNTTGSEWSVGDNVKLSENFPKDVPIYPDAKIIMTSVSGTDKITASVSYEAKDDVAKVTAWYESRLKSEGWKTEQSATVDGLEMRTFSKGDAAMEVTIGQGGDDGKATIVTIGRRDK